MKSKDEQIHELEQQVSDMAMEITRLKRLIEEISKVKDSHFIDYLKSLGTQLLEEAQNHQSNLDPLDL